MPRSNFLLKCTVLWFIGLPLFQKVFSNPELGKTRYNISEFFRNLKKYELRSGTQKNFRAPTRNPKKFPSSDPEPRKTSEFRARTRKFSEFQLGTRIFRVPTRNPDIPSSKSEPGDSELRKLLFFSARFPIPKNFRVDSRNSEFW